MKIKLNSKTVNWVLPSFYEEMGEIERYNFSEEEKQKIFSQFTQSNLVSLEDDIWIILNNTDSWLTTTMDAVEDISKKYNKDYKSILKAFKSGGDLPAPIIVHSNNSYELVAGNTRLMVARALGKKPKVLMINL